MSEKEKRIIIAIDGYASTGKSTLAKALAKALDYIYIDTGAMYRAVTLYFLNNNIAFTDSDAIQSALNDISINFKNKADGAHTYLNDKDVENEIRGMEVSGHVSEVAEISAVRRRMVELQQKMGQVKGVVMDGRDIGTVVFPNAELKIFLTADPVVRALRRFNELKAKGMDVSLDEVKDNLLHRDRIDSSREDSPLAQAKDAFVMDSTRLNVEEEFDLALKRAKAITQAKT